MTTSEPTAHRSSAADRSVILADVSRAATVVAPSWPLSTFVAVNPLGGSEHLDFGEATTTARLQGRRTHLGLAEFRAEHARGAIVDADLDRAIAVAHPMLAGAAPLPLGSTLVTPLEILRHDLIRGPIDDPAEPTAADNDPVTVYIGSWCAAFTDTATATWSMPGRDAGFYPAWLHLAVHDRRVDKLVGKGGRRWLGGLPTNPLDALDTSLSELGTEPSTRVDVLRALLLQLPGWAGYARWCDEWAADGEDRPMLRLVDLLAVLAAIEVARGGTASLLLRDTPATNAAAADDLMSARVDSVVARFGGGQTEPEQRAAVAAILDQVPNVERPGLWLAAHESNFRDRLLGLMQRIDPGETGVGPDAQMVMCIDVRSEGLRRHFERTGNHETFGFAGFFGVPLRWRPLGSSTSQARCPVLVTPQHEIIERPVDDPEAFLNQAAAKVAADEAVYGAKRGLGSPFAFAEAAGWLTGPIAGIRTLIGGRSRATGSSVDGPITAPAVDAAQDPASGFSLVERTLIAETIIKTIGFTRFAPLVVLCGHASHTTNNLHASSLDCGACGGAPGGPSARVAAAILNDPDVRVGLEGVDIQIPDTTWFVAAEHETAADVVTVLDPHVVPDSLQSALAQLRTNLGVAGQKNAAERARRLPGNPDRIRSRGGDWAEVRPEWGLAGNAAFVVGPRSMTRDLDLASRVFLHSYDAESDIDAVALETIMTAPLIVAQWISAQYYFSTVDNDGFGAGDKTLHNPMGDIGVVVGSGGDLATGLPLQSVSGGTDRAHEPLRLLAVVQAPLERIEAIIVRNTGLRNLVQNGWITVAGRSHGHEPWSVRTPSGTWDQWHPAETSNDPTAASLEIR